MGLLDWLSGVFSPNDLREIEPIDLPHWARVAFATRCARRVQPIFNSSRPSASPKHIEFIEDSLMFAEASAANAKQQRQPTHFNEK